MICLVTARRNNIRCLSRRNNPYKNPRTISPAVGALSLSPSSISTIHPLSRLSFSSSIQLFGFTLAVGLVRLFAQQSFELGRVGELDLAEPTCRARRVSACSIPTRRSVGRQRPWNRAVRWQTHAGRRGTRRPRRQRRNTNRKGEDRHPPRPSLSLFNRFA